MVKVSWSGFFWFRFVQSQPKNMLGFWGLHEVYLFKNPVRFTSKYEVTSNESRAIILYSCIFFYTTLRTLHIGGLYRLKLESFFEEIVFKVIVMR